MNGLEHRNNASVLAMMHGDGGHQFCARVPDTDARADLKMSKSAGTSGISSSAKRVPLAR